MRVLEFIVALIIVAIVGVVVGVIMPGSGVRKDNIKELQEKTGAWEFHSSLRSRHSSRMEFIHPSFAGSDESYMNPAIDEQEVAALRAALMK